MKKEKKKAKTLKGCRLELIFFIRKSPREKDPDF